jgi:hypothetical protein
VKTNAKVSGTPSALPPPVWVTKKNYPLLFKDGFVKRSQLCVGIYAKHCSQPPLRSSGGRLSRRPPHPHREPSMPDVPTLDEERPRGVVPPKVPVDAEVLRPADGSERPERAASQ